MEGISEELHALKEHAINKDVSLEEIQWDLSGIILSLATLEPDALKDAEKICRKFDNDMELIIYTVKSDNQWGAVVKLLDEVIELLVDHPDVLAQT